MFCFCIVGWEKYCASAKVQMLDLDPHKFSNPATEFVDYLKHKFMKVIVNAIEELLEFINCQITYGLPKILVFLGKLHICGFASF